MIADLLYRFAIVMNVCFAMVPRMEVITDILESVKSYKQLPVNFYQIQTKFRDEIRPRFGVSEVESLTKTFIHFILNLRFS